MGKAKPLVDDVLARVLSARHGSPTWFEMLPEDVRDELEEVRRSFNAATHKKRTFAKAVIAVARERGWPVCGVQGVERWLEKRS